MVDVFRWSEVAEVMGWAGLQAFVSVVVTMVLGFLFHLGLVSLGPSRWTWAVRLVLSLPNFVPVLFVVMSFFWWMDLVGLPLFSGFWSVIFVHALLSAGFAAVLIEQQLGRGLQSAVELACVEGATRCQIWWALILASRNGLLLMAMGFFGVFFSSFSVPLLVGGLRDLSLEILAFRYFSSSGSLGAALSVSLIQMAIFGFLVFAFYRKETVSISALTQSPPAQLGYRPFLWAGFLWTAVGLMGVFGGLGVAIEQMRTANLPLMALWLQSLKISVWVGLMTLALYLLTVFWYQHRWWLGLWRLTGAISTVFLGLCLYILPFPMLTKLTVGMLVLFFPILFRFGGSDTIEKLQGQLDVADVLGASAWQKFFRVSLPQALPTGLQMAAVASFWAVGEYAFSSVVTGQISNMALLARNLLGGYRVELASGVVFFLVLTGAAVFLAFWWLSNVSRQKLYS